VRFREVEAHQLRLFHECIDSSVIVEIVNIMCEPYYLPLVNRNFVDMMNATRCDDDSWAGRPGPLTYDFIDISFSLPRVKWRRHGESRSPHFDEVMRDSYRFLIF
jgi:hypothetical protein